MSKPRIFVSSTFYDLKHIRSSLEAFISSLGFEAILFENGNISYKPDESLDLSCYREAERADIFILIVGGRYGSTNSEETSKKNSAFYDKYTSITKREFQTAYDNNVPTYIFIEKPVFSEYETFKRNRNNEGIDYAHVDSVNVFHFIDEVINKPKNNPICQFEKHSEIEGWLKEQWAGLFKDLLSERKNQNQLLSISTQVNELADINQTLKTYLEKIISTVDQTNGPSIISEEAKRIKERNKNKLLENNYMIQELTGVCGYQLKGILEAFTKASSLKDLDERIKRSPLNATMKLINNKKYSSYREVVANNIVIDPVSVNRIRQILELPDLE